MKKFLSIPVAILAATILAPYIAYKGTRHLIYDMGAIRASLVIGFGIFTVYAIVHTIAGV
jgi:hypothetical protein